ncbi:MAG TPA: crosslink repair DNA glycosylase YcaQ family protein [Alphaproteobacteria bacterium]|nr:crosslink repair DNA glycosylase YcaQ family protein [Alphaproteobacteria bacterium]
MNAKPTGDTAAARAFVLGQLGLSGPLWPAEDAARRALDLGMIQIDSIRVNGLRNHEIAWAARTDAPVADLYRLLYQDRGMLETHYPQFATRRDWLPWFVKDFHKALRNPDRLKEMRPLMRKVKKWIREEGPLSPADLESERVIGGFNTIKETTRALEYLFYVGEVQISGRSRHFHRLFDLTERVAPELLEKHAPKRRDELAFFAKSAAHVLKLGTHRQLTERTAHHIGTWRGGMQLGRKAVDQAIKSGLLLEAPFARAADGAPLYALAADLAQGLPEADDVVRIIPPLDNLLFNRRRFVELFGFEYKFEAYTPQDQRRFYFAMPILYRHDLVGLVDAKKDGDAWRVVGLDLMKPVPVENLRQALHRLARIAGATRVEAPGIRPAKLRQGLAGRIEA